MAWWVIYSIFYTPPLFLANLHVSGLFNVYRCIAAAAVPQLSDMWMSPGSNKETHVAL